MFDAVDRIEIYLRSKMPILPLKNADLSVIQMSP